MADANQEDAWHAALSQVRVQHCPHSTHANPLLQYVHSLGCTLEVSKSTLHSVLHWLLNLAVARVFASTPAGAHRHINTTQYEMIEKQKPNNTERCMALMEIEQPALPVQRQHAPYHDGAQRATFGRHSLHTVLTTPACSSEVYQQCVVLATMLHCSQEGSAAELLTKGADVLERDVLPAVAGASRSWGLEHVPPRVALQGAC